MPPGIGGGSRMILTPFIDTLILVCLLDDKQGDGDANKGGIPKLADLAVVEG